jgi:16S rRNA (cytosine1402-N4)-methyltransferase
MTIHKPVLLEESIEYLNLKKGDVVVDATLGGGGHGLEILKKIIPEGKLVAIDLDPEAIKNFKKKLRTAKIETKAENLELVNDNFANLGEILLSLKILQVNPHTNFKYGQIKNKRLSEAALPSDIQLTRPVPKIGVGVNAILADFGISSDQLEDADRGFSFKKDAPLDMRMSQSGGLTAADIVNNYSERDLIIILKNYGDEKHAGRIVRAIIAQRKIKPIKRTLELVNLIEEAIPGFYKRQRIHFATRTFQALRIEVNKELENIKKFLPQAIDLLEKKGRLAAITFHSGEDRLVKNIFRENARGCICPPEFPVCRCGRKPNIKIITKKPVAPSVEETAENPRSRSAKLRVAERI